MNRLLFCFICFLLFDLSISTQVINSTIPHGKILLFVTTHLSTGHIKSWTNLWPYLMKKSPVLGRSDILFYINSNITTDAKNQEWAVDILKKNMPNRNITLKFFPYNQRQKGAMMAMIDTCNKGWFIENGYEWIIRVNPDVFIWNENILLRAMSKVGVNAVVANCDFNPKNMLMHTDFFAVRSSLLKPLFFQNTSVDGKMYNNAEVNFTKIMERTVTKDQVEVIVKKNRNSPYCRIMDESISHFHVDFLQYNWSSQKALDCFYNCNRKNIFLKDCGACVVNKPLLH